MMRGSVSIWLFHEAFVHKPAVERIRYRSSRYLLLAERAIDDRPVHPAASRAGLRFLAFDKTQ
jgi:hypothetical protein